MNYRDQAGLKHFHGGREKFLNSIIQSSVHVFKVKLSLTKFHVPSEEPPHQVMKATQPEEEARWTVKAHAGQPSSYPPETSGPAPQL